MLKHNGAQCPFSGACFKIHTYTGVKRAFLNYLIHHLRIFKHFCEDEKCSLGPQMQNKPYFSLINNIMNHMGSGGNSHSLFSVLESVLSVASICLSALCNSQMLSTLISTLVLALLWIHALCNSTLLTMDFFRFYFWLNQKENLKKSKYLIWIVIHGQSSSGLTNRVNFWQYI